jgi:hypothetical protein
MTDFYKINYQSDDEFNQSKLAAAAAVAGYEADNNNGFYKKNYPNISNENYINHLQTGTGAGGGVGVGGVNTFTNPMFIKGNQNANNNNGNNNNYAVVTSK